RPARFCGSFCSNPQCARRRVGKIDGHQYARGPSPSAPTLGGCFLFHSAHFCLVIWLEEPRLRILLHGAKQRAKPIPKVRVRDHVAGEFPRRPDRCFLGWPFRTSSLPAFPSRAQPWRLLFHSIEILRSVFLGRAQDSFESPPDSLPMAAVLHIPACALHPVASYYRKR